jgi:hypothetical protein
MASAILQSDLAGSTLGRLSIPLDFTPGAPKVQKLVLPVQASIQSSISQTSQHAKWEYNRTRFRVC